MPTLSEILHRLADAVPMPSGTDREQLHADIDTAAGTQAPADPAPLDMQKTPEQPPATTAYGPGALPVQNIAPDPATAYQPAIALTPPPAPVPPFPGQVG
ncbi:hypothetical protein AB0K51_12430 [Kitasatospora sp. NPDC049285]|uniref:hypothetical protein n=1 Tax=Kitasatospora sp. NPDC049285 TaxID=3157096 RepID=UPI003437A608